jgi:hypothetical protein
MRLTIISLKKLGMVVEACRPSTQEVKVWAMWLRTCFRSNTETAIFEVLANLIVALFF